MADAAASYKKQDGTVSVSADGKTVSWKSASGAVPLSIATAAIGSMTLRRMWRSTDD
jgi:transcription initiation factor TFIIH subunit 1